MPSDYRDAVAQLLYHAQTVEWLLRLYLSDLNEAADRLLRHRGVRFKTRSDDMRRWPLGQLVRAFAAHNDNADLTRRLRALNERRNGAAHNAFIWAFIHSEKPERVAAMLEQVGVWVTEADELVAEVAREAHHVSRMMMRDPRFQTAAASLAEQGPS